MQIKRLPAYCLVLTMLMGACSKKEHPQRETSTNPDTPNITVVTKLPVARVITVNDRSAIDKLKTLGVDGIITDYPNLFNTDK